MNDIKFLRFYFARIAALNSKGHFGIKHRIKDEERKLSRGYVEQLLFD